jgi:hypothetical protein
MYSDIIVVWMWYSTGIWVIRSTTVLLHFDSMNFPSRRSGCFTLGLPLHGEAAGGDLIAGKLTSGEISAVSASPASVCLSSGAGWPEDPPVGSSVWIWVEEVGCT